MMKKVLVVLCALSLLFAVGACKKKQEGQPSSVSGTQFPAGHPGAGPGGAPGGVVVPKGETVLSVPGTVKGKWKAVVLVVEDKTTKKASEYTVNLDSEFKIPNSNLKIEVGDFLPDFRMNGLEITSASNETKNPAVGVKIYESGKLIFPVAGKKWGWLYAKFPTMHAFEHAKYAISLKEGIKKG